MTNRVPSTRVLGLLRTSQTFELGAQERLLPHAQVLQPRARLPIESQRCARLPSLLRQIEGRVKEQTQSYLEEKAAQLKREGLDKVSTKLLEGGAAGTIIDLAQKTPDNLVAMCTHGRSGVGRWVLGSVTDRVVRHCGDPVLVVRAARKT